MVRTEALLSLNVLLVSTFASCATETVEPAGSDVPVTEDTSQDVTPPPLVLSATLPVSNDGRTETTTFDPPAGARAVLLTATPVGGQAETNRDLCFRFAPVETPTASWVGLPEEQGTAPGCGSCTHPMVWGIGSAGALLPSAPEAVDDPLPPLTLGVEVRNCALGIPASRASFPGMATHLQVEARFLDVPAEDEPLVLTVHLLTRPDALHAANTFWTEVIATAAARFHAAGVQLVVLGPDAILAPADNDDPRLLFGADGDGALHALATELRAAQNEMAAVPVALVGCLVRTHADGTKTYPAGVTTRIPGSADAASAPSFVAVAAAGCKVGGPPTPPPHDAIRMGLILAHELGHHLGLFHADAAPGLMNTDVIAVSPEAAWFAKGESALLRRHPAARRP